MIIAWDTETKLFGLGIMAPPLVCLSYHQQGSPDAQLVDHRGGVDWLKANMRAGNTLIGQNISYDIAVAGAECNELLPTMFATLDEGEFSDTKIREQLLAIADGTFDQKRFSLKDIASRRLGLDMDKGEVRVTFGKLRGTPIKEWPEAYVNYAKGDASVTLRVWEAQETERTSPRWGDLLKNEPAQVQASVALQLATCWGMRTDPEAVTKLRGVIQKEKDSFDAKLRAAGIMRADGTKDTKVLKALVEKAYGGNPPLTPSGAVATSGQVLLDSGDEFLVDLAGGSDADKANPFKGSKAAKYLSTYMPWLEAGTRGPINPSFEVLKVTGRTGSREPNIQNFPVKGGLRECFIPRPGFVFVDADYSTLELRTLAQSCIDLLGYSSMADALRKEHNEGGPDLHSLLAGRIYGEDPLAIFNAYNAGDKDAAEKRKLAKAPNFGLPGGMGVDKFVTWAKAAYKVILTRERGEELKRAYLEQWPEIPEFFRIIAEIVGEEGEGSIRLPRSGRVHGGKWFTEMCNLMFQGPAADGAKAAFYEVTRRCYVVKTSALYGSRPVAFVHDEILLESPIDRAKAAMDEMVHVMKEQMSLKAVPDIPVAVDAGIMERWGG